VTETDAALQTFDRTDPANVGRPYFFDLSKFIETVEMVIRSDEIQGALKMLDPDYGILPGWYRDNYPQELTAIRNRLYEQCYDPFDYASDQDEASFSREEIEEQCLSPYTNPRADILFNDIKQMNAEGMMPWIFEISPSHGWLPLGFSKRELKFTFFGKNLNQKALDKIKHWLPFGVWADRPHPGQSKILVCFEALEHMWNPHDLEQSAKKIGQDFDLIYLSTPKYTLFGGLPDWSTRRLGHVRTWTPKEFVEFASKSFPGHSWTYFDSHSMVIKGVRNA
jgi:hypothetical protein